MSQWDLEKTRNIKKMQTYTYLLAVIEGKIMKLETIPFFLVFIFNYNWRTKVRLYRFPEKRRQNSDLAKQYWFRRLRVTYITHVLKLIKFHSFQYFLCQIAHILMNFDS